MSIELIFGEISLKNINSDLLGSILSVNILLLCFLIKICGKLANLVQKLKKTGINLFTICKPCSKNENNRQKFIKKNYKYCSLIKKNGRNLCKLCKSFVKPGKTR